LTVLEDISDDDVIYTDVLSKKMWMTLPWSLFFVVA
jgi:hypothetical protein